MAPPMVLRPFVAIPALLLVSGALAGCFGDDKVDAKAGFVDGSKMPAFETTLFVNQVMFHPYPLSASTLGTGQIPRAGMLSAWMFTEDVAATDFKVPVLRVHEGQTVRVTLYNTHDLNHTIHWHGQHVPWNMDGVPYDAPGQPVESGQRFVYEFVAGPAGTHFFHCHVDEAHHLDMGMYGVLIVEPAEPEAIKFDSEEILVLDDWDSTHLHASNADAGMTVDGSLDDSGDPFNQLTLTEKQLREIINNPQQPYLRDVYSNPLRVERDWYPETYAPWQPIYDTFTINGKSYPLTDPIPIKEGESKRLRFINVGSSVFSMHIHGHHFTVTHKDGYPLPAPYRADTVPIHPGERYDVQLVGDNPGPWMLHDHMPLHTMNDHISPGGIMTMVVYEGFEGEGAGGHDHGGLGAKEIRRLNAGDFLGLYV